MDTTFILHSIAELDTVFQMREWSLKLKLELQTNVKLVIRDLFEGYVCVKMAGC